MSGMPVTGRILGCMACFVACVGVMAFSFQAQTAAQGSDVDPPVPSFDVASVKRLAPQERGHGVAPGNAVRGGWRASNATLLMILRRAYPEHSRPGQIVGGPSWIDRERFEINAKTVGNPSRAEVLLMLRRLLADRFALRTHVESREIAVYSLVAARSDGRLGPALRPTPPACVEVYAARARGESVDPTGASKCDLSSGGLGLVSGLSQTTGRGWQMSGLAAMLQTWMDRPVIDRTGLTGLYDFEVAFEFATTRQATVVDAAHPTVFSALPEQLGLKLEAGRAPMDVLVIDSVELPTPD